MRQRFSFIQIAILLAVLSSVSIPAVHAANHDRFFHTKYMEIQRRIDARKTRSASLQWRKLQKVLRTHSSSKVSYWPAQFAFQWVQIQALQDRRGHATRALKRAIRLGFWEHQRIQRQDIFRKLRMYRPFRKIWSALKKDTTQLSWLRMEYISSQHTLWLLKDEEKWRKDPQHTRLYFNVLPTKKGHTQAVTWWKERIRRVRKEQRTYIEKGWLRRRNRYMHYRPRSGLSNIAQNIQRARFLHQRRITQKYALELYIKRKKAAQQRAYTQCTMKVKRLKQHKKLFRIRSLWTWSYHHIHNRIHMTGQLRWSRAGVCIWGRSQRKSKGRKNQLFMLLTPSPIQRTQLIMYQPSQIIIAPQLPTKRKNTWLWSISPRTRLLWMWRSSSMHVVEYARNAMGEWSPQARTKWIRTSSKK